MHVFSFQLPPITNSYHSFNIQELHLADRVAEEIDSEENAQTKSLEDFNFALEARRKAYVKTLRRNAFKKVIFYDFAMQYRLYSPCS